ncbi:MAG TPA: glycine cleavage system protein H [Candidatus Sulfotelmatobacter sp.]
MFPGIDGFHWTLGHVLFLSLFFAVALTILITLASAAWRTSRDFRSDRAIDLWWRSQFAELPVSDRRCRHELAGRVLSRTCDNAFDCRHCEKYSQFAVLPATGNVGPLGLNYGDDRYYHRGHTWVKPEEDGTVTVGLDELAAHLVGTPDSVSLPEAGEELELNQTAWRMKKNGREIEVRAPIEGTITGVGGAKQGWYLKMRPRLDIREPATLRHLLRRQEVHGWLSRELERLQLQLRAPNTAPALADGGVLLPNLMDIASEANWDAVLADTFLQV